MSLLKKNSAHLISCILFLFIFSSQLIYSQTEKTEVKAGRFDTGKMWAFDFPPLDYFEETYGFRPTQEWLDDVRLSALRIPGCTASFVSEDGLIMTNNHCSDAPRAAVQKEGEDLGKDGFYAPTLEEERQVPGYYADHLVFMKDVTEEIQKVIDEGKTETEKIANKQAKIDELKKKYEEETGLKIELETFFNDSRFSIYGFKRYTDVRLVFIPEEPIGYFGGDYDNFTYPRYNLDCTFYRIYEDGKPIKCKNYFTWSKESAKVGEPLFAIGNPGTTNRLKTVSQLKYMRDVTYGNFSFIVDENYKAFEKYKSVYPEKADEFEKFRFDISNAQKVLTNIISGLNDPYLVSRKQAFENKLKEAVEAKPELKEKYGKIWKTIDRTTSELTGYNLKTSIYNPGLYKAYPAYFKVAKGLLKLADQLKLAEDEREESFRNLNIEKYISGLYPANYDELFEKIKLSVFVDLAIKNLGKDHFITKNLFAGKSGMEAADYILSESNLQSKKFAEEIAAKGAEAIYSSDDIFIKYVLSTKDELEKLNKLVKEANDTEDVYENLLGQLMYEVYGTSIPPDANFTLRITDGVLKDFDYNGTIAPLKTTFHGMYDRYYSFDKKYPWNLPERWQNPSKDFDLSTPFNFITTHDAVGGSSGSPVINKNAEVVGLSFDGNMDSIVGNFIYIEEENRSVAVTAEAIIEALNDLYGYKKLAEELVNGKLAAE